MFSRRPTYSDIQRPVPGMHLHRADRAGRGASGAAASRTPARRSASTGAGSTPWCAGGADDDAADRGPAGVGVPPRLWCRAWCRLRRCALGVVLLRGAVVVLRAWCFAWCGCAVVPGVVRPATHDRDPDPPADVQRAVPPEVVDRAQLPGPGVEPDGEPGRGVARADRVADQPTARVARPAVRVGGDQRQPVVRRRDAGFGRRGSPRRSRATRAAARRPPSWRSASAVHRRSQRPARGAVERPARSAPWRPMSSAPWRS